MWLMELLRAMICPDYAQPVEPSFTRQISEDRISSVDVRDLFACGENISIDLDDLHITDRTFKLVDIAYMKRFLDENPVSRREYVKEHHDCDDFSYILQGDVTRWDSDLAFGIIHGRTPDGGGHAWNVCIGTDRGIWFIEPQTDQVWKPANFWDIDRYEIWLVVM